MYRAFLIPESAETTSVGDRDADMGGDDGVDALISQLRDFEAPTDLVRRRKLRNAVQDFVDRLTDPQERLNHIVYSALRLTYCRIANDMNVFETLSQQSEPLTVQEVARAAGAETAFTARMLRYLASIRVITEVASHGYKANAMTRSLCGPAVKPAVWFAAQCHLPPLAALPDQVAAAKFRTPTQRDEVSGSVALRHAIAAPYGDFKDHPMYGECYKAWMATPFRTSGSFLDVLDLDLFFAPSTQPRPSFVDIGGTNGNICRMVSEHHPSFSGRVFLQDVDSSVIEADAGPSVTKLERDFWSEQPTYEPRFYYFQNVLARISDTFLAVFLKTVADAMSDDSLILADEFVPPENEAGRRLAEVDMILMLLYRDRYGTGRLRTLTEWGRVIESAGLELAFAQVYDGEGGKTIMVLRKRPHRV